MAANRRGWLIVVMTVTFMMINFADKGVVGLAAGPIMKDLKLTHEQFGEIGSAFFLLFSISAVLVGFIVNRVSTKIVLAVMAFIWAASLMPMIFLASFTALVASRIVLGAGEGPAYPVALHAVYKWFADDKRAFPTSFVSVGAAIGVALATPLLGWIIRSWSWHVAFGFLSVVGFVWLAVWLAVGEEGPLDAHRTEAATEGPEHVSYWTLLTSRTFIGVELAGFAAYWLLALAVVWVPSFLVKASGFTPAEMSWVLTLPPILQVVLSPTVGYFSERLRDQGLSSRITRALPAAGSVIVSGIAMLLLAKVTTQWVHIPLVMAAFAVCSIAFAMGPTLVGEISPVRQRGAMLGISNALFSTAGLIAPWLMGHIVDAGSDPAEGFRHGLLLAGLLVVAGGVISLILIHPEADLARFRRLRSDSALPSAHKPAE